MNPTLKKHLKQRAHTLKPVVLTGSKGLTDAVHEEIDLALNAHELIKIKLVANDKTERQKMSDVICDKHQCEPIVLIGHILCVYRENQDKA